jgi:hypothetical protein
VAELVQTGGQIIQWCKKKCIKLWTWSKRISLEYKKSICKAILLQSQKRIESIDLLRRIGDDHNGIGSCP